MNKKLEFYVGLATIAAFAGSFICALVGMALGDVATAVGGGLLFIGLSFFVSKS